MVSDRGAVRRVRRVGHVSIRFEVRGGFRLESAVWATTVDNVSIRFEVRGGFRRYQLALDLALDTVSIRFEVRGGFRLYGIVLALLAISFQSALRFAAVSDPTP